MLACLCGVTITTAEQLGIDVIYLRAKYETVITQHMMNPQAVQVIVDPLVEKLLESYSA
ncbi:MAG: hypothetical protein ABIJ21_01860 [Nanoarchaeota archaeon]